MTRLQTVLVLTLGTLGLIVLGHAVWALMLSGVTAVGAGVVALVGSVPTWAWWVLFGLAMSLRCNGRHRCGTKAACGT